MGVAGKPLCIATTADWCGEDALWHAEESELFWTDNRRNLIHRYSPEDRSVQTWRFDEAVVALTEDPGTIEQSASFWAHACSYGLLRRTRGAPMGADSRVGRTFASTKQVRTPVAHFGSAPWETI
jgi:sugar lactone lactonase YvrE